MHSIMKELQKELQLGSLVEGTLTYCGRLLTQSDSGIKVTYRNTAAKVRPIFLSQQRCSDFRIAGVTMLLIRGLNAVTKPF